jgi:hypothetical protein
LQGLTKVATCCCSVTTVKSAVLAHVPGARLAVAAVVSPMPHTPPMLHVAPPMLHVAPPMLHVVPPMLPVRAVSPPAPAVLPLDLVFSTPVLPVDANLIPLLTKANATLKLELATLAAAHHKALAKLCVADELDQKQVVIAWSLCRFLHVLLQKKELQELKTNFESRLNARTRAVQVKLTAVRADYFNIKERLDALLVSMPAAAAVGAVSMDTTSETC